MVRYHCCEVLRSEGSVIIVSVLRVEATIEKWSVKVREIYL